MLMRTYAFFGLLGLFLAAPVLAQDADGGVSILELISAGGNRL